MIAKAVDCFRHEFGREPVWLAHGPGRVNLIGEHTDYNEGFVFPAAIDRGVTLAAAPTDGQTVAVSGISGRGVPFVAGAVSRDSVSGWSMYPAGVSQSLAERGTLPNLSIWVESNLPTASGLSSSAAIELACAVLWNEAGGLGLEPKDLALLCQRAENEFVGMACGVMDQMASAMGREGHAMFLDTRSLDIRYAPLPRGLQIVVCDTGKKRELTASAYNQRRSECAEAAAALGVGSLRDCNIEQLKSNKEGLSGVMYRRAMHVLTENQRCCDFYQALESGDLNQVGQLMEGSHKSLRNNFEVSCIELDNMVLAAKESEGCIGARMTGAGFGGACVALVHSGSVDAFINEAGAQYRASVPDFAPTFLVCEAASGAFCEKSGQTISNPNHDMERH